jgi:aspartyl protease family protein
MANNLVRFGLGLIVAIYADLVVAEDVSVVGVFGTNKAVLVVDGGTPRTITVGQSIGQVKLVEVNGDTVTIDIGGQHRKVAMGTPVSFSGTTGAAHSTTLVADIRGHFIANGSINGASVMFLVDTGATVITIDRATAIRLGVDLERGDTGMANTANGAVPIIHVKLSKVSVGEVTLYDVDAVVVPTPLPQALLGMSFLNRMEMHRDGSILVLTQRF